MKSRTPAWTVSLQCMKERSTLESSVITAPSCSHTTKTYVHVHTLSFKRKNLVFFVFILTLKTNVRIYLEI